MGHWPILRTDHHFGLGLTLDDFLSLSITSTNQLKDGETTQWLQCVWNKQPFKFNPKSNDLPTDSLPTAHILLRLNGLKIGQH